MNRSGEMTALNLTYKNARQYQMGPSQQKNKEQKTAYAVPKKTAKVLKVNEQKNTYVNYPNRS